MNNKKKFLLGVGAQKAGTTWVFEYLSKRSNANFGYMKEYHVWDAVTLPEMSHFNNQTRLPILDVGISTLRKILGKGPHPRIFRGVLQRSPERYFDYFSELLARPEISLTGDITPSYAGLPLSVLELIRDEFYSRGVEVCVIFIMRDPVERCISAAKMNRSKSNKNEGVPLSGSLDDAVLVYARSAYARARADYKGTVEAVRKVFDENNIFFGIHESLFSDREILRLSEFAGVLPKYELARKKVNVGLPKESVSIETRAELRGLFNDTYEYCAETFPETGKLWMSR